MATITAYFLLLAILMIAIVTYLYSKKPNKTYTLLFVLVVLVIIWLMPFGILPTFLADIRLQTYLMRISNMAAAWHPAVSFFVINSIMSRGHRYSRASVIILVLLSVLVSLLDATEYVIISADFRDGLKLELGSVAVPLAIVFGALYFLYPIRFFLLNIKLARGKERIQMKYMALGLVVAVTVAFTTNTLLPVFFDNTDWYVLGSGVCLVVVGLAYYGFNEERLYDLDLLLGPVFNTRKYQFHRLLSDFTTELPLFFSFEKIVMELSRLLNCTVGIEIFESGRAVYAQNDVLIPPHVLKEGLKPYLEPGTPIRISGLGRDARSQKLKKILITGSLATILPMSEEGRVTGILCLGHGSIDLLYSKQDFEQLLKLCEQLSVTSRLINQKDRIIGEKESEISRLSDAIARLKPAVLSNNMQEEIHDIQNIFDENFPLIGDDDKIREIFSQVRRVAKYDTSILITGETGTGKENLARLIHAQSGRSKFVPVNCSAIPENLIESELFGYRKGAFTGADRNKTGLVVEADGGTLFLDEIGDLPLALQAKLLRVLQDGVVQPLGDVNSRYVEVRVIAATNTDLTARIHQGRFREDLFHRIRVIHFHMPSLKERGGDMVLLSHFFLNHYNRKYKKNCQLSHNFISQIQGYPWPGNVREMENKINRMVCLASTDEVLQDLDAQHTQSSSETSKSQTTGSAVPYDLDLGLKEIIERTKREIILTAIKNTPSQKDAAHLLKLKPSNLSMYLKKFNIHHRETT